MASSFSLIQVSKRKPSDHMKATKLTKDHALWSTIWRHIDRDASICINLFAFPHFQMPSSSNFDLSNGLFSLQIQPQSGEPIQRTGVNGPSLSSSATPAASSSGVPLRKGLMWQQGGHSKLLSRVCCYLNGYAHFIHLVNSERTFRIEVIAQVDNSNGGTD